MSGMPWSSGGIDIMSSPVDRSPMTSSSWPSEQAATTSTASSRLWSRSIRLLDDLEGHTTVTRAVGGRQVRHQRLGGAVAFGVEPRRVHALLDQVAHHRGGARLRERHVLFRIA